MITYSSERSVNSFTTDIEDDLSELLIHLQTYTGPFSVSILLVQEHVALNDSLDNFVRLHASDKFGKPRLLRIYSRGAIW